jgi:2-amino-4-hydroxy-6-hydroxymethyldihydropteridine diphosphokinase
MAQATLLTGSNEGDRMAHLIFAIERISNLGNIKAVSSFYKSSPWGPVTQNDFLNQVIQIDTDLEPKELLTATQHIEQLSGRKKAVRLGPRTLDIDLLYFNDLIMSDDTLTLPHHSLHLRRFTLIPLCEILPSFLHPIFLRTHEDLLSICEDDGIVAYFASCNMP